MRLYKTKVFHKWAVKEGLTDSALRKTVNELAQGIGDALGGGVYKKRVALSGRGKRGGARTLLAFKKDGNVFFIYGFAKNQQANIKVNELEALKLLARKFLGYNKKALSKAVKTGELIEMCNNDKN